MCENVYSTNIDVMTEIFYEYPLKLEEMAKVHKARNQVIQLWSPDVYTCTLHRVTWHGNNKYCFPIMIRNVYNTILPNGLTCVSVILGKVWINLIASIPKCWRCSFRQRICTKIQSWLNLYPILLPIFEGNFLLLDALRRDNSDSSGKSDGR